MLKSTILNCENRIFLKFLLVCPKTDSFRKQSDIAFVYLLYSIMLRYLKKSPSIKVMVTKQRCIIFPKLDPNYPFCPKIYCLEKLTVTIVYLLYTFILQHFKKNPQRANYKTDVCIILAQIGCEFLPPKILFGKVDQNCFGLTIPSCHVISKTFPQSRSWE